MFGESLMPVAHPGLGLKSLSSAKALSRISLLEFDDPRHPWLQWGDWLAAKGWADTRPRGVLHFNQYDQVIQAALAGQGVALGRLSLIQPLLDDHRLVALAHDPPGDAGVLLAVELGLAGTKRITIVNRSEARGAELVGLLRDKLKLDAELVVWNGDYSVPAGTDVVINGTSIGLYAPEARLALDLDSLKPGMVTADVNAHAQFNHGIAARKRKPAK